MKDFNWEEFKKGRVAVHCPEEYLAEHFFKQCIKNGINAFSKGKAQWCVYKENTCYTTYCGWSYCDKNWYENNGYKIIEWKPSNKQEGDNNMELNVLKYKVTEIESTLSELKAEIEKKENEIKAEKIDKAWKPKEGDTYYYLYSDGDIAIVKWNDNTMDNSRYNIGNCFKTEELATKERDKRILLTELERWALEHNEEEIDWNNRNQYKSSIYYNHKENKLETENLHFNQFSQLPYFTSGALAKQAIEIFGQRLKELVFN